MTPTERALTKAVTDLAAITTGLLTRLEVIEAGQKEMFARLGGGKWWPARKAKGKGKVSP